MEAVVRQAMEGVPAARGWVFLPDHGLPRLGRRHGAVLVAGAAVLVFGTDRAATEAAALDLAEFHAGCRTVPVLPVVLRGGGTGVVQRPLPLAGAAPPLLCPFSMLPWLFNHVARFPAVPGFDPGAWPRAAYRPMPGLMDAACALYARHGDAHLALAGSGPAALARTQAAVAAVISRAQATDARWIVFVTGSPGAGKTLCGLGTAFAPHAGAAFLTGNPALLHVLRGALVRDAASRGLAARAARRRVEAVVQPLHHVRDHYAARPDVPPDRVLVIDEAQRCWTAEYARRKTRNRAVALHDSEPGILLDAMARHDGWCAIVCLVGGGQEIHAGEGGIATWCAALRARPGWQVAAAPSALDGPDPRQRLQAGDGRVFDPALHLGGSLRAWRAPGTTAWVDALLAADAAGARRLAGTGLPVRLTRSLDALRRAVRGRGTRRFGLVATAGARRLRAEGLGGLLWHQDEDAVLRWFLDTWPDIRSSDALEVAATEFGVQGLELDRVGVCWDLDLVPGRAGWDARAFRATRWTTVRDAAGISNKLNAYRVLLTRARHATTIWVPRGDRRDPTRDPALYDAVADTLLDCGVRLLDDDAEDQDMPIPQAMLL